MAIDALVAVWMEEKGISTTDFAINHPAGKLGKKLTITAEDIMLPLSKMSGLSKNARIEEIIFSLTKGGIGTSWVEDDDVKGKLIGLITDGDLRRTLQSTNGNNWHNLKAENLMTKDPITIEGNTLVIDALKKMENNRKKPISVLPVLNDKKMIIGLLRLHDIIQSGLNEFLNELNWYLKKSRLLKIKLLIFDVDGVLTDGGLWYNSKGDIEKNLT